MKKLIYVLFAAIMASAPALAQSTFSIQYSTGFAGGDTKAFVSSPSFRGAAMEFRVMAQPNIGVGADVAWNVFYERRAHDTYTSGTASITGVQYRYINAVPIYLSGDYFFKPGEKVNPFVGLGVGTLFMKRNTDMNLYTIETDTWAFALRPEAGIMIDVDSGTSLIIVGKYNHGFSANGYDAQSYFSLNFGFVFKKR